MHLAAGQPSPSTLNDSPGHEKKQQYRKFGGNASELKQPFFPSLNRGTALPP